MQFVEHLTVVDKILNDTILYGWCARRMRPEDDINAYHLLYDTGTWYRPYFFFKFGFYVFESHDGWKIIYQRDTVLKDAKQQEFKSKVFPSYSQIGNTRFWVLTDEEK